MGVGVVRLIDAVARRGRGGHALHVARDHVDALATRLALKQLVEKLLHHGVPGLSLSHSQETYLPEMVAGHVGEAGLAHGVAVEEGENALAMSPRGGSDLSEEEVAEEVGDHLVGLEDALVGLNVALVPRDAVGDAVEDHPQLPSWRRAVMLLVTTRTNTHEAAFESIREVFFNGVFVDDVLRQVEGLQVSRVQVPMDADAQRVRQTGREQVCGERGVAGENLHRVYVRRLAGTYRKRPGNRRLPSHLPCCPC